MIMPLYDMKFRITLFDVTEISPCVLFFPMYFLVSTRRKKPKQTFKFCNGTPTSITDVTKILSHFLLQKVCIRLKLNFCTWSFSLQKEGFCLNLFCLFALVIHDTFFSLADPGLSTWTRQIILSLDVQFIYSFFKQIQLAKLLHMCITKLLHI